MKKLFLLFVPLVFVALYVQPASAQIEMFGTAGAGAHWDADNTGSFGAFGGLNTFILEKAKVRVIDRTTYYFNAMDSANSIQAITNCLYTRVPVYRGTFLNLGGGAMFDINNPDARDKTYFNLLFEVGYSWAGIDFFAGTQVMARESHKEKLLYAGIGLN